RTRAGCTEGEFRNHAIEIASSEKRAVCANPQLIGNKGLDLLRSRYARLGQEDKKRLQRSKKEVGPSYLCKHPAAAIDQPKSDLAQKLRHSAHNARIGDDSRDNLFVHLTIGSESHRRIVAVKDNDSSAR